MVLVVRLAESFLGAWAWTVAGIGFALFSAMNFYTHIGMYDNIANGTMHKW